MVPGVISRLVCITRRPGALVELEDDFNLSSSTVVIQAGLGVIMDWAPAHFPETDTGGPGLALMARRCTNMLILRQAEHPDRGTLVLQFPGVTKSPIFCCQRVVLVE